MTALLLLLALLQPVQAAAPDLDTVVQRATAYVTKYEAELGNLIGTEDYLQIANWLPASTFGFRGNQLKTQSRHTSSDFMIIQVGNQWVSLREVNLVDGKKVVQDQPPLETAFDNSPQANAERFNSMKADSSKYNIGGVLRENNLPTFALAVLRGDQAARFSFQKEGMDKINGTAVWKVQFKESRGPALVSAKGGQDLYSSGTLWIDPDNGQVLKTEFRLENRIAKPEIHSTVTVTYRLQGNRNILVPVSMVEHYETSIGSIDCHATYSRFHPYTVDVKFDAGTIKP